MDGRTRGTTVDRGTRSGVRHTGTCRRRRQAAQDRLGRRETAIDRAVDGPHPYGPSGRASPPDRNSRAGLARKLCARILLRTPTRGARPAHRTLARRLWAQVTSRKRVAENSALSSALQSPAIYRIWLWWIWLLRLLQRVWFWSGRGSASWSANPVGSQRPV